MRKCAVKWLDKSLSDEELGKFEKDKVKLLFLHYFSYNFWLYIVQHLC